MLKNLVQAKAGTYVDATFGRGGHSRALLRALDTHARVVTIDRDPTAVAAAQTLAAQDTRLSVLQGRFSQMTDLLEAHTPVQGVLMDLGVSSPQLDTPERGFSFRAAGPLDMRMNPEEGESAAEWLNRAQEAEIATVLKEFGEERFARRIAKAIVAARPFEDTLALADVVAAAVPGRGQPGKHPATRTFQAVRIFINEEMQELDQGLQAAFAALAPAGRLAVISFHSLEDRAVKQLFRRLTQPPALPRRVPVRHSEMSSPAEHIAGPVRATAAECAANPRARSATLRVIAKKALPSQEVHN